MDGRKHHLRTCVAHIAEGSIEDHNTLSRTIFSILHLKDGFDALASVVSEFLNSSCERISYGHKSLRELSVWENRNINDFDESFREYIFGIRRHRLAGKIILLQAVCSTLDVCEDRETLKVIDEPKKTKEEPTLAVKPLSTEKVPQVTKKARIMDYFQVLPKEAPTVINVDSFFMPFHPKPNTRMQIHSGNLRRRRPAGYVAKCWNDIESYSVLKLKLLQFSEDCRPAYFGNKRIILIA